MDIVLLVARLLLTLIFVVAGIGKLADLAGSKQALRDFGVPAPLATPLGILLPLAELAVALALIPTTFAWWGALGALVLLLLFVAGISYNLARGRQPDCHCFGQLHSAPAGWFTLTRNLILAAVAGFVVWFGRHNVGPSVLDWPGTLTMAHRIELLSAVILLALLIGVSWVLAQVLSQQGRLLLRIEALETQLAANGMVPSSAAAGSSAPPVGGPPLGSRAPAFALSNLNGETTTLDALRALGKPVVLIFSDPACGPCMALLPQIGRWQREQAAQLVLVLMSRGTAEVNRAKASEYGLTHLLLQRDREVAEAYQAYGTPSAILIRRDGTIGSAVAVGADAIRGLITNALNLSVLKPLPMAAPAPGNGHGAAHALAAPSRPRGLALGEPAPKLQLPDLSGKTVTWVDFRGHRTLVLFWNPACGFCQRMLEDLKAWEANPPQDAPKLLVVSRGTLEENQAMGLCSLVVLDQDFTLGRSFGAQGTPSAILIDSEGKIASELAEGGPDVLRLSRARHASLKTQGSYEL